MEGSESVMISINTDNGADILLELLRQSQIIKDNMNKIKKENTLEKNENKVNDDNSTHTRASLRSPEIDANIILSKKEHYINQRNKDESYLKIKGWIEKIINSMTAQDYKRFSDAGFQVEELTIESLTFALQLIKDYANKNSPEKENLSKEKTEKTNNSRKASEIISEDEIKIKMEAENLPVNKESVDRVSMALKLSEDIPHMDRKDILYLLGKKLAPTIENLYKARYSSQSIEAKESLSDKEWKELAPQVSELIDKAGIPVDPHTLEGAKELIKNKIPLTMNNLGRMVALEDLRKSYDKDIVLDRILKGMTDGTFPGDINLLENSEISVEQTENITASQRTSARQLIEDIHGITDEAIIRTVDTDQDLTLENLLDIPEEDMVVSKDIKDNFSNEKRAKLITAKRQLEEVRLKMTIEAAIRLEKQGIKIETETLERVVEKLRIEEEIYYKELFKQEETQPNDDMIQLLQMTTKNMDELRFMPAHVLGTTVEDRKTQTVSQLLEEGRSILSELDKAKGAYETLFTEPRAEYGDSIQKAFGNVTSLMEEMGIENTQYNKRAIRILGYNQMEITKESIEQIKAYDLSINNLLNNLNPALAMQIIKDGTNPLNIPIDELNNRIETIKDQGYSSIDKYSSYLYRLEKKEGISEAERKAYIGIYRLLYQIEKSDGAALGALIKSDQKVTLNHLLTAIRSTRKAGMDYKIDDEFGLLKDISFNKESISDQLRAVFSSEQTIEEEVQSAIAKELLNSLTPSKLQQLHNSVQESERADLWETIGKMPIEQLLEQVKNIQESPGEDQAYYFKQIQELHEIYNKSDQAIRFLNEFKLPCTTSNLMMAGQIINNGASVFKKLYGYIQDEKDEETQKDLKKKLELSDTLIDKETMNEAYEELEEEVKAFIEKEAIEGNMDFTRLTQLKNMGMQMHFIKNLARREFYQIPMEASGKITNINLTIVRGKSIGGKVTLTLISDRLGNVKAEASLKDDMLSGYIACDHVEGLNILESQTEALETVLQEEKVQLKQLNFFLQQDSEAIKSYQSSLDLEGDRSHETERVLYRLAKAMIHIIRSAEEADSRVA